MARAEFLEMAAIPRRRDRVDARRTWIDRQADVSAWAALAAWPVVVLATVLSRVAGGVLSGVLVWLAIACVALGLVGSAIALFAPDPGTRRVGGIGLAAAVTDLAVAGAVAYLFFANFPFSQRLRRPPLVPGALRAGYSPSTATHAGRRTRGGAMPLYLSRFSYTPETWARMVGNPEDRQKAARSYIESVGGKLHGFWYAFGTHDGYNLWEAPDNVSMAAVALAISSGGALSSFETTVLLTVDETMDALRKAEHVQYHAPGA